MRIATWLGVLLAVAVLFSVVTDVAARLGMRRVWDDAYMYERYADHLLAGLGVRWNAGEPPTFGLTALLFLAPVTLLRALGPPSDDFAVLYASVLFGVVLIGLLAWLALRATRDAPRRGLLLVVVLFGALGQCALCYHFTTGMDTTFALAALCGFMLAADRMQRTPTRLAAITVGALGGGLFVARPDLLLFPASVLLTLLIGAADAKARRLAWCAGLVAAAVLAAQLGVARWYFGSALPLPFYAKAAHRYGADMDARYALLAADGLVTFTWHHWPLLLLAVSPLLGGVRRLRATWGPVELGLFAATAAFCVWCRFFVLQVMPAGQRFYYPMVPPLVYLACRAAAQWLRDPPLVITPGRQRVMAITTSLLFIGALGPTLYLGIEHGDEWLAQQRATVRAESGTSAEAKVDDPDSDAVWISNAASLLTRIFAVAELPDLPDDLVVAGTEIGFIGLRASGKRVVDLCGLHDTDFALHGFSADRLLTIDHPDLLYLPHHDYTEMRAAISGHPTFKDEYERFSRQRMRGLTVALRRTSPHYARLRELLTPWLIEKPDPPADDSRR